MIARYKATSILVCYVTDNTAVAADDAAPTSVALIPDSMYSLGDVGRTVEWYITIAWHNNTN